MGRIWALLFGCAVLLMVADASLGSCVPVSSDSVCAPYYGEKCGYLWDGVTTDQREDYFKVFYGRMTAAAVIFPDAASFE
jgi:hypothetical protein